MPQSEDVKIFVVACSRKRALPSNFEECTRGMKRAGINKTGSAYIAWTMSSSGGIINEIVACN